jgi:hypothetical protein
MDNRKQQIDLYKLRDLLESLEWLPDFTECDCEKHHACPICGGLAYTNQHLPDCQLNECLKQLKQLPPRRNADAGIDTQNNNSVDDRISEQDKTL